MCLNKILKKKTYMKTLFHFTKIHFNLVCKGITQPCFDLTFAVQNNPVLALILAISRITETLLKKFKLFGEPSLWLTNQQEGKECSLLEFFLLLLLFACLGGFGFVFFCFGFGFFGREWFGLLRFGLLLGKNCRLSPGFKLTP